MAPEQTAKQHSEAHEETKTLFTVAAIGAGIIYYL